MKDSSRYFNIIDSRVRHSAAIDYELSYEDTGGGVGIIMGTLWFADGSRLEFTEVIGVEAQQPTKLSYSYQYMQNDETVFRYDNSEHHRRVATFPHHKHAGRKVVAALEPTLKHVLEEIATIMEGVEG
jgi:hypothetical protein